MDFRRVTSHEVVFEYKLLNRNQVSWIGSPSNRLNLCMLSWKFIIFDGGKNCTWKEGNNSFYDLIDSCGNSANYLHVSPIKETGKNLYLINSWEFSKKNGPLISTKFLMCSWETSWAKPLKTPFFWKSCNTVLVIQNTVFHSCNNPRAPPSRKMAYSTPKEYYRILIYDSFHKILEYKEELTNFFYNRKHLSLNIKRKTF